MKKRIDYKRSIEINKKKKRIAKLGILSAFGMIGLMSATPAFASEWSANEPENISIEQGATSYTMKSGDTLWAIGMKINVNVNTLASINNINLSNGEQFTMPVGTVINFSESEIKAVNSNGQAVNEGVQVNDSNKIVKDKPIGTDVSKDVSNGTVTNNDVVGQPDNTGKLPAPNTGGTTKPEEKPSTGGDTNPVKPVEPTNPVDPTNPTNPVDPEKPTAPTNKDVYVTVNVDENGSVLDSTAGYEFISESTAKSVETLENGNTVTTYTTTKVWKESGKPTDPTNENKYVTINVDTKGTVLSSVVGYSFVSESTQSSVQELENGNTITTYTTTKVWQLNEPTEVVPVDPSDVGNSGILTKTLAEAGAQGEAMHNDPNSEFYHGNPVNGDWDLGYAWKTEQVLMTDGSKWYTVVFYVVEL